MFSNIYLWVGMKSNKAERNNIIGKVEKYVESIDDGRDKSKVNYVEIDPLSEPFTFKSAFPEWEDEVSSQWLELDPYEARMAEINAEKAAAAAEKAGAKEEAKVDNLDS